MRGVILAAGRGARLSGGKSDMPKCLVTLGGETMLSRNLRLLRGAGCYADDVNLPGQVYASMVRSPHAHARILSIRKIPGVIAVLTGQDAIADSLKPIPTRPVTVNPHEVAIKNRDGSPFFIPPYPALPMDEARFVGEAVAMVVGRQALEDFRVRVLPLAPPKKPRSV